MSEDNKQRNLADIGREYSNGCVKAGDLQYKIAIMTEDLAILNQL